jgi:hypothetical protein
MLKKNSWVLLFLFAGLSIERAKAAPIVFSHRGMGAGSIGGVPFPSSRFEITAFGDTSARLIGTTSYVFYIPHTAARIDIEGLGSFQFTSSTRTFVNQDTPIAGFSRGSVLGSDLFNGPEASNFFSWDMLTSIGPITGVGYLTQWASGDVVITTGGALRFVETAVVQTTFQATVIPEPSMIVLAATGVISATTIGRRNRRNRPLPAPA